MGSKYGEMFSRLSLETATVLFIKNNGEIRCMLATRNCSTADLVWGRLNLVLAGHDKRCNMHNGNISVIDLEIGEPRSFNVDRVISIEYYDEVKSLEELEKIIARHKEFKARYDAMRPRQVDIDDLV